MLAYPNIWLRMFQLLCYWRHRLRIAFNNVVRRIFLSCQLILLCVMYFYIGSKLCDILIDERQYIYLLMSYSRNDCETISRYGGLLEYEDDFFVLQQHIV